MKIAFLDRDGTINRDYEDSRWSFVQEPEILDGSIEGLLYLKEKGFKFIIITNQYIIGEGYITENDYHNFNNKLIDILASYGVEILDVFYCPHRRGSFCNCNKPSTGLIEQALEKYNNIDMNSSILIGDSLSDMELAEKMGLTFYGIKLDCDNKLDNLSEISECLEREIE